MAQAEKTVTQPHPDAAAVFAHYPKPVSDRLIDLRTLILKTASQTEGVGDLVETLKWGQPSYHPRKAQIGTTIRVDAWGKGTTDVALFVPCQTSLIDEFKAHYGGQFAFEGKRALRLPSNTAWDREAIAHCIAMALTYHLRARQRTMR